MRILVAGWHGQIALALSEAAIRRDDVVAYAVGRQALDLADRPSLGRTLFSMVPDVVINTAAYTNVDGAELEPEEAYRWNTKGAAALAEKAAKLGIPIIHLSSVYVFDGRKTSGAYSETDRPNPINVYGRSKLDGEREVAAATPRHIILRTGWIYSPFGRNFVSSILGRAQNESVMHIDNSQRGSPTYAPHLAEAILDIAARIVMEPEDGLWGRYHIANRDTASWYELAAAAIEQQRPACATTLEPSMAPETSAPRPLNATIDCTKLNQVFGVTLPPWRYSVEDCVRRMSGEL